MLNQTPLEYNLGSSASVVSPNYLRVGLNLSSSLFMKRLVDSLQTWAPGERASLKNPQAQNVALLMFASLRSMGKV